MAAASAARSDQVELTGSYNALGQAYEGLVNAVVRTYEGERGGLLTEFDRLTIVRAQVDNFYHTIQRQDPTVPVSLVDITSRRVEWNKEYWKLVGLEERVNVIRSAVNRALALLDPRHQITVGETDLQNNCPTMHQQTVGLATLCDSLRERLGATHALVNGLGNDVELLKGKLFEDLRYLDTIERENQGGALTLFQLTVLAASKLSHHFQVPSVGTDEGKS